MTAQPATLPAVGVWLGLLRAMRPKQWVKNVLVGAAPLAAASITQPRVALATLIAFVAFSLAASAGYLFNDVLDVEADRHHPDKQHRPIASGLVSPRVAVGAAALLCVTAVALAALNRSDGLLDVIVVYLALTTAYSAFLKHERVIDLAVVAAGFLLRAMAGGLAAGLPLSRWFLLVAAFGALFLVSGKRYAESLLAGAGSGRTRRSLAGYSPGYLRFVWSVSAGVTIVAYALWAFETSSAQAAVPWQQLSIAPFVIALLRYAVDIDSGRAGAPEQLVLQDRALQALGVIWLVMFSLGAFRV